MPIPDSFIDELNARLDIVDVVSSYVSLTQKGTGYWGLCPFHREKTPSFHVSPERGTFHCFGCNKGGGAIRFVMEVENLSFPDAVRVLAQRAGMEVPEQDENAGAWRKRRDRVLELNKEAARFYRDNLSRECGAAVRAYIDKRRITPRFVSRFGLGAAADAWDTLIKAMTDKGYDKAELLDAGLAVAGKNGGIYDKFRNRLMLPVIDVRGDVIGFTSRVMDASAPKYLNTPETALFKKRTILYGLNYAKSTKRPNLILVEGNIDVITLHQAGFDNAIATMGTALTEEHIKTLGKYTKELVLCYDNDSAGTDATQRALGLLREAEFAVKVLQLPRRRTEEGELVKQDADDFIKYQGAEAFEGLLNRSENSVEYRMAVIRSKYDLDVDEQKVQYLLETADLVASLPNPVERTVYGGRAAALAGVSPEAMEEEVKRARSKKRRDEERREERAALNVVANAQPKARELRYSNPTQARAEEVVLRIVMMDGDYFRLAQLEESDFSSPLLGKAYMLMKNQWEEGRPVSLPALEQRFTADEMDHLTRVASGLQSRSTAKQALEDSLNVIRSARSKQQATDLESLNKWREGLKETKGYGG